MINYDELLDRIDVAYALSHQPVLREAIAAIRDLQAKLDAVRTRPIAEAPKDGTWVLIDDGFGDMYSAYFKPSENAFCDDFQCYPNAIRFIPLSALTELEPKP